MSLAEFEFALHLKSNFPGAGFYYGLGACVRIRALGGSRPPARRARCGEARGEIPVFFSQRFYLNCGTGRLMLSVRRAATTTRPCVFFPRKPSRQLQHFRSAPHRGADGRRGGWPGRQKQAPLPTRAPPASAQIFPPGLESATEDARWREVEQGALSGRAYAARGMK